ncbi:MAG: flippase-like domain-containing protein [candidate division KSB1 bacterium]|nr:flippase-like domain-containing protein [candidate division KSB1 bacterium]MDZ7272889.1 flippase-like domain-containing protein [candidate division KSB1 bacterium]MDZ7284088.1 flippase-like domain-containing protein [candidate division KSB1 bacterium]MDZ7297514.1 flippase-like domain-containing protein [candidate division KSB1 bacterium]MDZ7308250.1 flippase-like domain-containing protein [candidate division KSB1 bacterium]
MPLIIVLSLGLLITSVYSVCTIDQPALEALRHFPPFLALLLLGMALAPWLLSALRLSVWMSFLRHPARFREILRVVIAAEAVAAITPTAAGGGYFKFGWLVKRGMPAGTAASLMLLGTLEEYCFFLISLPAVLSFSPAARELFSRAAGWNLLLSPDWQRRDLLLTALIAVAIVVAAGWLAWRNLPERHQSKVVQCCRRCVQQCRLGGQTLRQVIRHGGWRFFATVGLAGGYWVCRCSLLVVLLEGLRQNLDAVQVMVSQWLLFMVMNFMPSPGAVGGAEFGFLLLYRGILPPNFVGVLSAAWRVLTFTLPVGLAALVFMWHARQRNKKGIPPDCGRVDALVASGRNAGAVI